MSFSRPIQWYHAHVDPIWPDGTIKKPVETSLLGTMSLRMNLFSLEDMGF